MKEPRKTVKDLGVPAAKAKVPEPTPFHQGLEKVSKRTQKREAGLLNDPNIKYQGSSDDSHSLSESEEEKDKRPMSPSSTRQAFRTHFDVINEHI